MQHPAPEDPTAEDPGGAPPADTDPASATEADDLPAIESDLEAVDSVLEAIDRGELDEAESTVSTLESAEPDVGPADQVSPAPESG